MSLPVFIVEPRRTVRRTTQNTGKQRVQRSSAIRKANMAFFDKLKSLEVESSNDSLKDSPPNPPAAEEGDDDQKKDEAEPLEDRWTPESEGQLAVDVYQTEGEIVIRSTIAGVKPEHLDITIENDMVSIKGKRENAEDVDPENYFCQECYFGPFSRSIILPVEVDSENAHATMADGVLTIRLPKVRRNKTKKLEVKLT